MFWSSRRNNIKLGEYAVRFIIIKPGIDPVCNMLGLIDMLYKERITCDNVVFVCFKASYREELLKHPPTTIHELTHVLFTMAKPDNKPYTAPLLKRIQKCVKKKKRRFNLLGVFNVFKRSSKTK